MMLIRKAVTNLKKTAFNQLFSKLPLTVVLSFILPIAPSVAANTTVANEITRTVGGMIGTNAIPATVLQKKAINDSIDAAIDAKIANEISKTNSIATVIQQYKTQANLAANSAKASEQNAKKKSDHVDEVDGQIKHYYNIVAQASKLAQSAAQTASDKAGEATSSATTADFDQIAAKNSSDLAAKSEYEAAKSAKLAKEYATSAKEDANNVARSSTVAQGFAKQATDKAKEAKDSADQAVAQAKVANTTANDAKTVADQALAKAQGTEKTANEAKTVASNAETKAISAEQVAKAANNQSITTNTTANDAKALATSAETKASGAEKVAKATKTVAEDAAKDAKKANDVAHKAVEIALANKSKLVENLKQEIVETKEKVKKITQIISGFTQSYPDDNNNNFILGTATVDAANRLFPNNEKARQDYLMPNNSNEQLLAVHQIERQIVKTIKTRINKKSMLSNLGSNPSGINSGSVAENLDIWVSSGYQYSKEDSFNNQDYYKVSTTLFSVGIDANLTESTLLGISYGQSKSNSNIYGGATGVKKGQDDINSQDVAVYISNDDNQLNSSFTLLYTKNEHESIDADITIPKYNSEVFGFNIDINRAFDISRSAVNNNLIPELILNVQMGYAKIDVDAHQSKFDGTNVEKKESNLFNLTIGPAISKKVKLHNNTQLNYKLGMGYTHIIANDSTDDRLTLMVNNNNISRVVINRKPSAHNLNLDATFDLQFNSNFNLELNADYTIGDHMQEYGASLIARYKF